MSSPSPRCATKTLVHPNLRLLGRFQSRLRRSTARGGPISGRCSLHSSPAAGCDTRPPVGSLRRGDNPIRKPTRSSNPSSSRLLYEHSAQDEAAVRSVSDQPSLTPSPAPGRIRAAWKLLAVGWARPRSATMSRTASRLPEARSRSADVRFMGTDRTMMSGAALRPAWRIGEEPGSRHPGHPRVHQLPRDAGLLRDRVRATRLRRARAGSDRPRVLRRPGLLRRLRRPGRPALPANPRHRRQEQHRHRRSFDGRLRLVLHRGTAAGAVPVDGSLRNLRRHARRPGGTARRPRQHAAGLQPARRVRQVHVRGRDGGRGPRQREDEAGVRDDGAGAGRQDLRLVRERNRAAAADAAAHPHRRITSCPPPSAWRWTGSHRR